MSVQTGFEKDVEFTQWTYFSPAELEAEGETELIDVALQALFASGTFEEKGRSYAVARFNNVSVRLSAEGSKVAVILYGTLDLAGQLVNA